MNDHSKPYQSPSTSIETLHLWSVTPGAAAAKTRRQGLRHFLHHALGSVHGAFHEALTPGRLSNGGKPSKKQGEKIGGRSGNWGRGGIPQMDGLFHGKCQKTIQWGCLIFGAWEKMDLSI